MKANARQYAESLTVAQAAGERNAKELVNGLMRILRKKKSTQLAKKILEHLLKAEAEKKDIVEVTIETAHEAENSTKKKLLAEAEKIFPHKKVQAAFSVQSELGSGFRIRTQDKERDQTLKANLTKLRNQLTYL